LKYGVQKNSRVAAGIPLKPRGSRPPATAEKAPRYSQVYMLKIFKRENNGFMGRKRYIFRSSNMAGFSQEDLVRKIAAANTTVTEADTLAVLNITKRIILDYVEQGYTVKTPIGTFYASASGTTDDIWEKFTPQDDTKDHMIRFLYRPATDISDAVLKQTRFERASDNLKTLPHITLIKNAAGNENSPVRAGDIIRIIGNYLEFDDTSSDEGVFLVHGDDSYRLSYYTRNTAKSIEARIEPAVPAGEYTFVLKNTPTAKQVKTVYKKKFIVSA